MYSENNVVRSRWVIWIVMFATLLLWMSTIEVHAPTIIRVAFATGLWAALLAFPFHYFKYNDFGRYANIFLVLIIVLTIVAVLRSMASNVEGQVGNKWLTLFGNDECMFMMFAPCFVYLAMAGNSLHTLKNATFVFLIFGTLSLIYGNVYIANILWFSALLFPYARTDYKLFVIVSILVAIYISFFVEETSRSTIVVLGIVILVYFFVYILKNKKMIWVVSMFLIFAPLVYSILMLMDPDYSVFKIILDQVFQKTGDETLATDTRSFLFGEVSEDLTKNHAWLLGKGALSHYYSSFFAASTSAEADASSRIGVEVTLLQLLLRSGVIYVASYYALIITAVVTTLKKAKSSFLLSVALMASGWSFMSCMSYLNGCNFIHLGFFLLLGCCLSEHWRNYSDEDFKRIFSR